MQTKKDDSVSTLGKCSQMRLEDSWGNSSVCGAEKGQTEENRGEENKGGLHGLKCAYLNVFTCCTLRKESYINKKMGLTLSFRQVIVVLGGLCLKS